ncbi:MAG: hypothetical protein ABR957_10250 [Terracidiphilus sp.]
MSNWKLKSLLALVLSCACAASCQTKPFIAWKSLHNPVLSYPNWSVKDTAMAYRQGTFYVFFSAFYDDHGQVRCHVAEVSTRDFKRYSDPIFDFDGEEDGWTGMCSPDVQFLFGEYVMTFNSWGNSPGKPNQLFYETSKDLMLWSNRKPLAPNLTSIGDQHPIDASLAEADGGYYLVYKESSPGIHSRPRMAFSTSLEGPFNYVGDGIVALLMKDGKDNGFFHENFEFLHSGDQWFMLATDYLHNSQNHDNYDMQAPYLYALDPGSHWLQWTRGYMLDIPGEAFNAVSIDNAAALYDWRKYDGYYYLIYAGRNDGQAYAKRGWNRIALARSKDLIHWSVPGQD